MFEKIKKFLLTEIDLPYSIEKIIAMNELFNSHCKKGNLEETEWYIKKLSKQKIYHSDNPHANTYQQLMSRFLYETLMQDNLEFFKYFLQNKGSSPEWTRFMPLEQQIINDASNRGANKIMQYIMGQPDFERYISYAGNENEGLPSKNYDLVQSSIFCASSCGHLEVVKDVVKGLGLTPEDVKNISPWALSNSVSNKHFEITKFLILMGADSYTIKSYPDQIAPWVKVFQTAQEEKIALKKIDTPEKSQKKMIL